MLTRLSAPEHLSLTALAQLEQDLLRAENPHVLLDLARTPTLGVAALALLVDVEAQLRARGGSLRLAGCSPRVQQVLARARLERLATPAQHHALAA